MTNDQEILTPGGVGAKLLWFFSLSNIVRLLKIQLNRVCTGVSGKDASGRLAKFCKLVHAVLKVCHRMAIRLAKIVQHTGENSSHIIEFPSVNITQIADAVSGINFPSIPDQQSSRAHMTDWQHCHWIVCCFASETFFWGLFATKKNISCLSTSPRYYAFSLAEQLVRFQCETDGFPTVWPPLIFSTAA